MHEKELENSFPLAVHKNSGTNLCHNFIVARPRGNANPSDIRSFMALQLLLEISAKLYYVFFRIVPLLPASWSIFEEGRGRIYYPWQRYQPARKNLAERRKVKTMNIEISTKEYRDLLDVLHIADVVMSGHRKDEDNRTRPHRTLIQKLYSLARNEDLDGLISYNMSANKYVPTAEFEEKSLAHAVVDAFGDHLFWDELISRLSARDTAQIAGGVERLSVLSDIDRQAAEVPFRQRYIQEFSKHGVANLEVVERFSFGKGIPVKTSD